MVFPQWVDRLFDHGYTSCPLARGTTLYINQGTNNANPGTFASPRNCNTFTDLCTFINANQGSGNVRFRLDQNDTWRAVAATCTDKITISQPNITIDSYNPALAEGADATGRATLIGGTLMGNTGWTNDATYTNLWYKATGTANTRYLKWGYDGSSADPGLSGYTIYRRYAPGALAALTATLTAMNTTAENAFVFDTTNNRIYVRSTYGTPNGYYHTEQLLATEDCIVVGGTSSTSVDGTRIDSLVMIGWGMTSPASQKYAVRVDTGGDTMTAITRCSAFFGSHHQLAMLGTGAGVDGGYLMIDDCEVGYSGKDGTSGAEQCNAYSDGSGIEFICRNVRGRAGSLKGWNSSATIGDGSTSLIYAHTAGGGETIALMVTVGCGIDADAVDYTNTQYFVGARCGAISTTGMDADYLDTTKYRCFEVSTTSQSNWFQTNGAAPKIYINCYHNIVGPPAAFTNFGAGTPTQISMWINSILSVKDTVPNVAVGSFSFIDQDTPTAGTCFAHMVNSIWMMRNDFYPVRFTAAGEHAAYSGTRIFNSGIWGVNVAGSTATISNPINQAPSTSQGGCAGLIICPKTQVATSGNSIGYDQTTSPTLISKVPNDQFRLIGLINQLATSGVPVNVPQLQVDYDMFFRPRSSVVAGPVGGDGIGAEATAQRPIYIFD